MAVRAAHFLLSLTDTHSCHTAPLYSNHIQAWWEALAFHGRKKAGRKRGKRENKKERQREIRLISQDFCHVLFSMFISITSLKGTEVRGRWRERGIQAAFFPCLLLVYLKFDQCIVCNFVLEFRCIFIQTYTWGRKQTKSFRFFSAFLLNSSLLPSSRLGLYITNTVTLWIEASAKTG